MKFGKEFQQILDDSKFPDDWKSSAIEYRQLKKLIKDVVSELSSMGLSPDVLHRLLSAEDDSPGSSRSPSQTPIRSASPAPDMFTIAGAVNGGSGANGNAEAGPGPSTRSIPVQAHHLHAQHEGNDEVLEFEFDSDEASPPTFGAGAGSGAGAGQVGQAVPRASASGGSGGAGGSSIIKIATGSRRSEQRSRERGDDGNEGDHEGASQLGSSYGSANGALDPNGGGRLDGQGRRGSSFSRTRNLRVRLLSDGQNSDSASQQPGGHARALGDNETFLPHSRSRTEPIPIRPIGVADMMRTQGADDEDLAGSLGSQMSGMVLGTQLRRPSSAGAHGAEGGHAHGHGHRRTVRTSINEGGIRAQYVFAGDSSHPEPQLRFHLPAPAPLPFRPRSTSPSGPSGTSDSATTDDDADGASHRATLIDNVSIRDADADDDLEELKTLPIPAPINLRPRRPGSVANSPATLKGGYANGSKSPFLASVPAISISSPSLPASPTLQRLNMVKSPIFALASGGGNGSGGASPRGRGWGSPKVDGLRDLSLGEAAVSDTVGPQENQAGEGERYEISLGPARPDGVKAGGAGEECTPDCPANPASPTRSTRALDKPSHGLNPHGDMSYPRANSGAIENNLDKSPPAAEPQHNHPYSPTDGGRDIIVPLSSDRAFFDLLTAALSSLSAFHAAQQEAFRAAVERLCVMISNSIVPQGNSVRIMPIPPVPGHHPHNLLSSTSPTQSNRSPSTFGGAGAVVRTANGIQRPPQEMLARRITKLHKKDLYAWREIFTLWIEAEVFESSAERTRGERTVEEAEARLQAFAHEVVKRGLGDRRTFRGKKTREAWEEFLRLNVLLLDLKRFQLANINAARKILKKHDKRTALTASTGFQSLARATLSKIGADGSVSTWTFYNTSLPHVLLASLTDILLPILPSLDDYACLICTSIAFKPIRLSCQHLFCVRCLVKMQRKGQAECPLCRSPTVLLADKSSLDTQIMDFMRDWFPREVKAKQRENDEEIAEEIRAEERGESADCVVM